MDILLLNFYFAGEEGQSTAYLITLSVVEQYLQKRTILATETQQMRSTK